MIRLFAALFPSDETRDALAAVQAGLAGARWRPAESLHITLSFFGEVRDDVAEDLEAELAAVAGQAFEIAIAGMGVFGEATGPRHLWAAVEENAALSVLAGRCARAARRAGAPADRRAFRPHVTLASVRGLEPARVAAWVQANNLFRPPPFRARTFGLYSSHRGTGAPHYRPERLYRLG